MDLWVIITVAAAAVQTLRLLMQKRLKGLGLSTGGATFSRFFFNAPLIFSLLAGLVLLGEPLPGWPPLQFWGFVIAGGVGQIIATFCTVALFSERSFAVGVAFTKSETLMVAVARANGERLGLTVDWRHGHWFELWAFLLPLSMFQVVPDWVLSQMIGILAFPDLGAPRIGTVPVYMAGMWVIPLFWVLLIARGSPVLAGGLALLVFAASEWAAPHFGVWRPLGVRTWQGVAHYVLLPEALLGWAAAWAYREVGSSGVLMRLMGAGAVSIFYTGALIVSYFLMQRAGL